MQLHHEKRLRRSSFGSRRATRCYPKTGGLAVGTGGGRGWLHVWVTELGRGCSARRSRQGPGERPAACRGCARLRSLAAPSLATCLRHDAGSAPSKSDPTFPLLPFDFSLSGGAWSRRSARHGETRRGAGRPGPGGHGAPGQPHRGTHACRSGCLPGARQAPRARCLDRGGIDHQRCGFFRDLKVLALPEG